MAQGRKGSAVKTPHGGTWNMSRWSPAPAKGLTIFQGLGIHRGMVAWPQFAARMPQAVNIAQKQAQASAGSTGVASGSGGKIGHVQPRAHPKGGSGGKGGPVPHGSPQAIARALLAKNGWSNQWPAFNALVMSESGWDTTIHFGGGHGYVPGLAYGIPQALPGSKMASAGADWKTNPATQLRWMMGYIRGRYGDPNHAWAFHRAHGSY